MSVLALCLMRYALVCAAEQPRYYAHEAVTDAHGVIAPWYTGQNGQFDLRVRIAAETMKRYPWVSGARAAVAQGPEYIFNGTWRIADDGTISVPDLRDWDNGDFGQRAAYVLTALADYYRYSGDPAAIAHMTLLADFLVGHSQTGPDHPWPNFLVSVPTLGTPYGQANPDGMIQLDIVAEVGIALLEAYQIVGERRWFDAAAHWGDLLAQRRDTRPGMPPWNRYANPESAQWGDAMSGGIVYLLTFFDSLIRLGHGGEGDAIVAARDAGRTYLRDVLLPKWAVDDTWGRNYWDWENPVQSETVTDFAARYFMSHPKAFPNWQTDVRNVLGLFLNRTGVSPASNGDVYSGAWAFPESSGCCGRSLWYAPMQLAPVFAQYAHLADDPWARELARRMQILATYDVHENGIVEDNIDGGAIVARSWFKITHPMALKHVLATIAWMPDLAGPARENHLVRSTSVITHIVYGAGGIEYTSFDAPAQTIDVLRLAYQPERITAGGQPLPQRADLDGLGYTVEPMANGDCIVAIRRDGRTTVRIEGPDPQQAIPAAVLGLDAAWQAADGVFSSAEPGAAIDMAFTGNQVRLIGRAAPDGGLADVYLDGEKQLVHIDCWNPSVRENQVLYSRNGLAQGEHRLRIVSRGQGNPVSKGARVYVSALHHSEAGGHSETGSGGGPSGVQRMIFGYTKRADYIDTHGAAWRPAFEWVTRAGHLADVVDSHWWAEPRRWHIDGTPDPELYRYGVRAPEFWANLTAAPGTYFLRLKFTDTLPVFPVSRAVSVWVNGEKRIDNMDIAATAGGMNQAVDIVLNDIAPKNGTIEVRFRNEHDGVASIQALELGPGHGGSGAEPVAAPAQS